MTLRDRIRRLRAVLRDVNDQCREGVLVCERCGHEESMRDLDVRLTVQAGLHADDNAARRVSGSGGGESKT